MNSIHNFNTPFNAVEILIDRLDRRNNASTYLELEFAKKLRPKISEWTQRLQEIGPDGSQEAHQLLSREIFCWLEDNNHPMLPEETEDTVGQAVPNLPAFHLPIPNHSF